MPLYLGIDAGGTKTDCAISNGAELLGQATGPTCKIARVGEEQASRNLHDVIMQACEAARVKPFDIQQVCLGISGASVPGVDAWARRVIQEIIPGKIIVMGDQLIAHRAAFGLMPGVLVNAGTGSFVYGCNEKGETARAGGWGPLISDEASAFWIGREAVASALRLLDRGAGNELLPAIAATWRVSGAEEVLKVANSGSIPKFAELADTVAAAAEKGQADAHQVMERAGKELAALAGLVISRLWPVGANVRVAMVGGVLQGSNVMRRTFQHALQSEYPKALVSFTSVRPVMGALAIASERRTLK